MSQNVELRAWHRLHGRNWHDVECHSRVYGVDLFPQEVVRPGATMRIRCVRLQDNQVLVSDVLWLQKSDDTPLYTVETGHRVLRHTHAISRISAQGLSVDSSHSVSLVLLHELLSQTAVVLNRIEQGLTVSMQSLREFLLNVGTDQTRGAEDLAGVDEHLSTLNVPLSIILQSLDDLEQAALRLRRLAREGSSLAAGQIDELISEIEGVQRRARFTLERQRYHRRAAGETVTMSDLNVTKVFSVVWAAFIPGTALINWYGQNFRVMPGLSWDGSLWTQLLAVLVLTAVPLLMVKQSGALR